MARPLPLQVALAQRFINFSVIEPVPGGRQHTEGRDALRTSGPCPRQRVNEAFGSHYLRD